MTEDLRSALREIADVRAGHAGHLGPPNPDDLWQLGTRRRRRGRAMLAAGAVVAAGLLAGLAGLWNVAPQGDPFSPAGGGNSTATLSSYPEYVAKPLRIKDISEAPGRKTAVISSSDTTVLYAVAPDGAVSKVSPEDEFGQGVAALSPDGRYLSYGFHLVDLVSGIPVDNDDASRLSMQRMPSEQPGRWSPSSQRVFIGSFNQGQARSMGVVVDTGSGLITQVPVIEGGVDAQGGVAGWVEETTLLAFVPSQDGRRYDGWTWTMGTAEWLLTDLEVEWGEPATLDATVSASLSPDRSAVLLARVDDVDGEPTMLGLAVDVGTGQRVSVKDTTTPNSSQVGPLNRACPIAWQGRSAVTVRDGAARLALHAQPLMQVSRWFDASCISFAGNEVQGVPIDGTDARAWESTQRYGIPILAVLALVLGGVLVRIRSQRRTATEAPRG